LPVSQGSLVRVGLPISRVTQGCGVWDGLSGNAYGLLSIYRVTGNTTFLHRAQRLAGFMEDKDRKTQLPPQEFPYSLFYGDAGGWPCLMERMGSVGIQNRASTLGMGGLGAVLAVEVAVLQAMVLCLGCASDAMCAVLVWFSGWQAP
jgi:hypothetical protein